MSAPLRFVSWAAVSSLPQTKKVSLEDQLKTNREHIDRHGGQLVAELVVPGESRSIVLFEDACRRIEAYARLKELIDARAFDVLIYLDRSRLGRKASLSMAVVELCHEAGILTYETENPPLALSLGSTPRNDDMLIGAIKSVGAQQEIHKLQERHKMGMIGRIKRGEFPAAVPYGWRAVYHSDGTRHIEIDEDAAKVVRLIFLELYLHRGLGMPNIGEALNEMGYVTPQGGTWSKDHVQGIFNRIWRYAGYSEVNVRGNRPYTRAPGNWPPIISVEEAKTVLAEKERRRDARRSVSTTYLFSFCVYCVECGRRMVMATQRRRPHHNLQKSLRCPNYEQEHNHRQISEKRVRKAVREAIRFLETEENRRLVLEESGVNGIEHVEAQIATEQQRREELHKALLKADDAYVLGRMDEQRYQRQVERLGEQIRNIEQTLQTLQERLEQYRHESQRAERLDEIARIGLEMLEHEDVKVANAWLRRHFRIWVKDRQVFRIDYL